MQELIAVRVKDGVFVGNAVAAQDRDFITLNKITHVINCAGGELPDLFADDGVKYLTFPWKDPTGSVCTAVMFDSADENIKQTVQFIDEALGAGDCVLVHSQFGLSRSPALIAAYMIMKYDWKLESAISFLEMAHKDMCIKPHFMRQLRMFSKRNHIDHDVFDVEVDDSSFGLDNVQWMLRNTLLNGLTSEVQLKNELYKSCTNRIDIGLPVKVPDSKPAAVAARSKKNKRIAFVDTKLGTDVDSDNGTPVVLVQPARQVEPGNHFLGYHGTLALHNRRRSSSIMRRSIIPCVRRVESDPDMNSQGRQELTLRSDSKSGNSGSIVDGATSSQAARTASGHSTLDCPSHSGIECHAHIPSPNTVHASIRSPFATLTSGHKYRKGSPLPMTAQSKSPARATQRPSSAVVSDSKSSQGRASSQNGPTRLVRSAVARSGSPSSMVLHPSTGTSTRLSSYRNIAPHRCQANTTLPPWNARKVTLSPSGLQRTSIRSSPISTRPSSPADRSSSAPRRVASTNVLFQEQSSRLSGSMKGPSTIVLRRQLPATITSNRR
ncbi:Dual specificity phosphatase catalytic domain [Trypanosoma vivax]|uniref:Putative dual specificity protein phosphatase n=1 Tax=Trypanosoma vivax (strain Y486) TaxID=1055687 RepID=G0U5G1_TRYVY|nr:putative dual specificity protein phosphatase [Trypanosoma vivax]KAH8618447.1 Dual specificity phosphatase catalytic domain [Trypanosoma vivax]CCC51111.1 putative dual specificity protein phosphatase [Trypanosoma vivax Y486]